MGADIVVTVDDVDADPEHREALTLSLRNELLATDVDDVRRVEAGEAPMGTRAIDPAVVGQLVVGIPGSLAAIATLITTVRGWLGRGTDGRTVELSLGDKSLKLGGAGREDQDRLVAEFLRSVEGAAGH